MPRVANPPTRGHQGRSNNKQGGSSTPHKNSPMKIPLNDDEGEKAARLQSRQALHDRQMDQIKAAVKTPMPPMRKYNSYERASSNSPRTPRGSGGRGRESDVDGLGRAVTPMKRVPLLANFEEWMKMATDNKINATNSWNFALIDYFHDMSLLLEGDGVNFQKASCTLDGCVKIYTSRVDSVATETGKLLSGLADSNNKKKRGNEEGGEGEDEEEEEGEDGVKRKVRKKQRSHESTLAPTFASLQLKKFELEFAVDPLFKKASADFDEGGAKGLLLNHLAIDSEGRIVFDSSDDAVDTTAEGDPTKQKDDEREETADPEEGSEATPAPDAPAPDAESKAEESVEIDVAPLASKFFPDLNRLMEQDICPSLKDFDLGDPSGSLDVPFLKAPEDWRQDKEQEGEGRENSGIMLDDDNAVGFDDDDVSLAGFDLGGDTGFGEGGEAWARDAALGPMLKVHRVDGDGGGDDTEGFGADGLDPADDDDAYAVSLSHQPANKEHENILSYFDNALQKNWAGPEHWRIRRIKANTASATANPAPRQRKEKEPFEINFESSLEPSLAEMIYTPASSNSAISLPKTQWKTKGRNLLPDDKHFNSRQLLRLFLKPKARMGSRRIIPGRTAIRQQADISSTHNGEIDEAYWANHKPDADPTAEDGAAKGTYDADFFADDDGLAFPGGVPMDDDDDNLPFADAREVFSPPVDPNAPPSTSAGDNGGTSGIAALLSGAATPGGALMTGGFGTQLVTKGGRRIRPEYVAYARVAKKVDVRRLKEEMWKGMGERLIASSSWATSNHAGGSGLATLHEEDDEDEGFTVPPTPTPAARMHNPNQINNDNVTDVDHDAYADAVVAELEGEENSDEPKQPQQPRLRFTSVMRGLKNVYPEQKMRDISTSYGFICLLHLANEKGLSLKSADGDWLDGAEEAGLQEVFITKDLEAAEAGGGE